MTVCPYTKDYSICSLSSLEPLNRVAYCENCSQYVFQCVDGHWNRAFARFCTQCSKEIKKPTNWEMASANPQRTAILQQELSEDSLNIDNGVGSWAAGIPEIELREDLPKLIAIDGLIIIPNTNSKSLDAYSIIKHEDDRQLTSHWSIELKTQVTLGNTPIYHGLHLYTVVLGGILKTNILNGRTEQINMNGIDTSKINPISTCAPLKLSIGNSPTMVAGLAQGILLLDLNTYEANYIEDLYFEVKNRPLSPVLCGSHIVFTSIQGEILTLNLADDSLPQSSRNFKNIHFSAPVTLGSLVYFEALDKNGNRAIVSYEPVSDKTSVVVNFDNDQDLDARFSFYIHPTLTDGRKLFVSDRYAQPINSAQTDQSILGNLNTNGGVQNSLITYRSIVLNNRIYSTHDTGLSVYSQDQNTVVSGHSLAMGWIDNPFPIAPPIQYGNKLFILCQDRLVCRLLGE